MVILGGVLFRGHAAVALEGLDEVVDVFVPQPRGDLLDRHFFPDKDIAGVLDPQGIDVGKGLLPGHVLEKPAEIFRLQHGDIGNFGEGDGSFGFRSFFVRG